MAPTRRRFASACALLALAGACARNPVTGHPQVTLVSEAKERELSEAEGREVAETMGLYDDPALLAYVRAVGDRLARVSPRQDVTYVFQVVDMEEPNAFALPAGQVYVSRGLLVLLNAEDELAAILGHEVAHVAARHAAQRTTRAAPIGILTWIGATVTGIVSPALGGLIGGVGGLAGALVIAPYSRGQEYEADDVGQQLAAKAGWDPSGLSAALRTLEREEALHRGEQRPRSFFAIHPPLPDRVVQADARAAKLARVAAAPVARGRAEFVRKLDGLPVGPRARDGLFDGRTFRHPDLGFRIQFPEGWKTVNGRTLVGAGAPDGRAVVALGLVGQGDDPDAALRDFDRKTNLGLASRSERLTINGLPASRATATARTRDGPLAVDLTWIVLAQRIYRVTGLADPGAAAAATPAFRATAESFRPLTAAERAAVRETRLRMAAARRGETLAEVLARTQSSWNVATAAVANGVEENTRLEAEQPLKVAVAEPYTGGR